MTRFRNATSALAIVARLAFALVGLAVALPIASPETTSAEGRGPRHHRRCAHQPFFGEATVVERVAKPWRVPEQQHTPVTRLRSRVRPIQDVWPELAGPN